MLNIPYESNPGMACALACYTMTSRYFFPKATFDQVAKISDWQPGYIIWAFKFWYWIMEKGIKITDYDLMDLAAWAGEGLQGLKNSASEKEFNFYINYTKNIKGYSEDIKKVLTHPNFTFKRQRLAWENLVEAYNQGGVCEVVLDSASLDKKAGFTPHRVVILEIDKDTIVFHDPRKEPRPARRESLELFKKAWLEAMDEPELCIYNK